VSEHSIAEEVTEESGAEIVAEDILHEEQYERFRIGARIEHAILIVSFTLLALTGLPQMFALTGWGQTAIWLLGGIETVRLIHRVAAFALIVGSVYHLFTSAYRLFVKHEQMAMLPVFKDARDMWDTVRHNLGFLAHPPKMGKFNFAEKLEYWSLVWGTVIMILTGFMLWNPIATTYVLPGQIIPAAKAAHGYEALLAVLAIVIWHMYHVHFKQFNPSMFTGKLPRHQMEEEHALELERLERGGTPWPEVPAAVLARRRRVFFVVSTVVGILILALLIWAFTFEQTAITTVPRASREVFVPLP
jgi:cytochrome b subunit of formate dehydrogenase